MKTKIRRNRLIKLIEFLEALPREKFYFGNTFSADRQTAFRAEEPECATVGCAIGWAPTVFPRLVKWAWVRKRDWESAEKQYKWVPDGFLINGMAKNYVETARQLFGLPYGVAYSLFTPGTQAAIHPDLPYCDAYAAPKRVAKMLRKFLALVDAGEIDLDSRADQIN